MNKDLRARAKAAGQSCLDYLLKQLDDQEEKTGIKRILFAACPNSITVLKASLQSAKRTVELILHCETYRRKKAMDRYFHAFNRVNVTDLI